MRYRLYPNQLQLYRQTLRGLLVVWLLLCSGLAVAQPDKVLLLASKQSSIYQAVAEQIQQQLHTAPIQLDVRYLPDGIDTTTLDNYDLLVAIGTRATQELLDKDPQHPVFSIFIPKQAFQQLSAPYAERLQAGSLSGLYLEQPFNRQLKLLKLIQPFTESLGTILGPGNQDTEQALIAATHKMRWQLYLQHVQATDNPIAALSPIISRSDAFLAIPDRAVFNRSTAKWILLMTFRQRIPLIAYSRSYVEAGALAAIYSTPQTVGEEAARYIRQWQQNPKGKLPTAGYPQLFDLSVNRGTAQSLDLTLPSEQQLKEDINKP